MLGHQQPRIASLMAKIRALVSNFACKKIHLQCTAPQKLDMKNLTFGVFFYEINL